MSRNTCGARGIAEIGGLCFWTRVQRPRLVQFNMNLMYRLNNEQQHLVPEACVYFDSNGYSNLRGDDTPSKATIYPIQYSYELDASAEDMSSNAYGAWGLQKSEGCVSVRVARNVE